MYESKKFYSAECVNQQDYESQKEDTELLDVEEPVLVENDKNFLKKSLKTALVMCEWIAIIGFVIVLVIFYNNSECWIFEWK